MISRADYLRFETGSFVEHYHKNSIASLLGSLKRDRITEEELDELSAFVERVRRGGGTNA